MIGIGGRNDRNPHAPIASELRAYLEEQMRRLRGNSITAEAIRYVQSRWDGLTRFLNDGRLELDTNPVERAMRPIVIRRGTLTPIEG